MAFRRRARASRAAAVVVLMAVAVVAIPRIVDAWHDETRRRTELAQQGGIEDYRVITFALRAVAQAGLMDPLGDFFEYKGINNTPDGWRVTFASSTCYRRDGGETCEPNAREDAHGNAMADSHFDVVLVDGFLRVVSTEGPLDAQQEAEVAEYAEAPTPVDPHPEFAPVRFTNEGRETLVRLTYYWAGEITEARSAWACSLVKTDADGDTEPAAFALGVESPPDEEWRLGGVISTGVADGDAASMDVTCSPFRDEAGWRLGSDYSIKRFASDRAVDVRGELIWNELAVIGLDFDCVVSVTNAGGAVVGERAIPAHSPWPPKEGPPYVLPVVVTLDVPSASEVDTADVTCSVAYRRSAADDPPDGRREDVPPPTAPPRSHHEPPSGPRHLIATDTLEGPEWGENDGDTWELYAWEAEGYRCWSFALPVSEGPPETGGRSCTQLTDAADEGHIHAMGWRSPDGFGGELGIAYGEVGPNVASVEVVASTGSIVSAWTIVPDAGYGISSRFWVASLEAAESFVVRVYDADGNMLEESPKRRV
ncbi:MAG TPA: hypothetical protein VNC78_02080 [Actinomycetota bacterium]|nr:hypothetical protein [Actinomycetota bacterium]